MVVFSWAVGLTGESSGAAQPAAAEAGCGSQGLDVLPSSPKALPEGLFLRGSGERRGTR